MSETFTKMFSSITESTVWCEPNPTRLTWITMLAMSDRNGNVWASIPGLAARARVSIEEVEAALEKFQQPDKYSRTTDYEGRRIEPIEGGWHLLNHKKYRDMGNPVRASLNNDGYVYYVGLPSGSKIKIGFSKNPWARLATLRTTEPGLEILATEATTMRTEGERHKQFAADRLEGEWFRASPSLLALVHDLAGRDSRKKTTTKVATVVTDAEAEADTEAEKERGASRFAPKGFQPTLEMRDWATTSLGFSPQDISYETVKFIDYERPRPIKDWNRAWRNWMRKAREYRPADPQSPKSEAERLGLVQGENETDERFQRRLSDALVQERYG